VRGRELEGQFDELPHTLGPMTGAIVLDGALAGLECRTVSVTDAGDHTVLIGEGAGSERAGSGCRPAAVLRRSLPHLPDCPD
jgi:hypothetical protein